jgi:hypothetical protein
VNRAGAGYAIGVTAPEQPFDPFAATLRKAVAAMRDADVPYLLGGSLATWARGGPESHHDLDLMVKPEDAERALDALAAAGMRSERPPEEWLFKAWDDDVLVDVIFEPMGLPMTDEVLNRGETLSVLSMTVPVMALEDVLATKLLALGEHHLDLAPPLRMARALREQIDWEQLRARTRTSPYAAAFFALVESLGVAEPGAPSEGAQVRVLGEPAPGSRVSRSH